jgi:hypothetical protein
MTGRATLILLSLLPSLSAVEGQEVLSLMSKRELFVDHRMIASIEGLELRLHHPHREGTALLFNKPWEGPFSGYITVIQDGGTFRMYYRGLPRVTSPGDSPAVTCYAESEDGIHWRKPDLRMYLVMGTRKNNVVLAKEPRYSQNFSPFLDSRPGVPPEERFKAVAGDEKTGLVAFASPDGLHWKRLQREPIVKEGTFDSQNVAFYSESESSYVCYFRSWTGEGYTGFRTISRTTSKNFHEWSEPVEMTFGPTPREHLYTNGTQPYFRAPQIYLALAKRFLPDKPGLGGEEAARLVGDPAYRRASSDAVLLSSRGGECYDRTFLEAFIRPGPDPADWVSRDNTPAVGLLPGSPRELFLYRLSHYAQSTSEVTRYSLRLDGFVSVHATYAGGEFTTPCFRFSGRVLEVNCSTSAAGGLRVEIEDSSGHALPGYALEDCPEMIGDNIARVVRWKGGSDLEELAGSVVRLRFAMRDMDLYSFCFR